MPEINDDVADQLQSIFLPSLKTRIDEIKTQKGRFVHYTSAENAIKIVQSKSLWMRNARSMSDYTEILHGQQFLVQFFQNENNRKLFIEALEPCGKEIAKNAIDQFDSWWPNIESNTFISCISEHEFDEDNDGRLSMWRAYGHPTSKAAIVLNVPFKPTGNTKNLSIIFSPVKYYGYDGLEKELYEIINNIKNNSKFLIPMGIKVVTSIVVTMLIVTAVSLKYKGFKEEKEWRAIYLPTLQQSKLISFSTETINGVPQVVFKIPLEDNPTENIKGLAIPQLIDRIIIGPSIYPISMYQAFTTALNGAGVKDFDKRVFMSRIPLRT